MGNLFDIPYLITTYGYLGIFIIVFLESGIFFALPGDTLLFSAGLLAPNFDLNIFFLVSLIFVATFTGGIFGYVIGVKLHQLQNLGLFKRVLKKEHLDMAHEFFNKHGKPAVLFCRFVPIVRTFVPIVAGVARMNHASFLKYNLLGSLLWSTSITLAGYFLGRSFPIIKDYISLSVILILLVSLTPFFVEWMNKKRKKKI